MANRDYTIGITQRFDAKGMDQMNRSADSFNRMSEAADRFIAKGVGLAAVAASVGAAGAMMLGPFERMRQEIFDTGTFYEKINVEIRGLLGGNKKLADEMFSTLARASVDIPYSFRELLSGMKEFIFLGINVKKTYGEIQGSLLKTSATGATAMAGLAAASGASFETIAHDVALAIGAGRADYLTHWIGGLNAQMLQMSGAFIGTYQMQYDNVMKYLNKRYGQFSLELSRTFTGIMQNFRDLKEMFLVGFLDIFNRHSAFGEIRKIMADALQTLSDFFLGGKIPMMANAMKKTTNVMKELGNTVSTIVMPLLKAMGPVITELTRLIIRFTTWFSAPEHRKLVAFLGRGLGLMGLLLSVTAAFIAFQASINLAQGALLRFGVTLQGSISAAVGRFFFFAAAFYMLVQAYYHNWGNVKVLVDGVIKWIISKMEWVADFFTVITDIWANNFGEGITKVDKAAWDKIGPMGQKFAKGFFVFTDAFNRAMRGEGWGNFAKVIGSVFSDAIHQLLGSIGSIKWGAIWSKIMEGFKKHSREGMYLLGIALTAVAVAVIGAVITKMVLKAIGLIFGGINLATGGILGKIPFIGKLFGGGKGGGELGSAGNPMYVKMVKETGILGTIGGLVWSAIWGTMKMALIGDLLAIMLPALPGIAKVLSFLIGFDLIGTKLGLAIGYVIKLLSGKGLIANLAALGEGLLIFAGWVAVALAIFAAYQWAKTEESTKQLGDALRALPFGQKFINAMKKLADLYVVMEGWVRDFLGYLSGVWATMKSLGAEIWDALSRSFDAVFNIVMKLVEFALWFADRAKVFLGPIGRIIGGVVESPESKRAVAEGPGITSMRVLEAMMDAVTAKLFPTPATAPEMATAGGGALAGTEPRGFWDNLASTLKASGGNDVILNLTVSAADLAAGTVKNLKFRGGNRETERKQ
jgi:hypothetical protein